MVGGMRIPPSGLGFREIKWREKEEKLNKNGRRRCRPSLESLAIFPEREKKNTVALVFFFPTFSEVDVASKRCRCCVANSTV